MNTIDESAIDEVAGLSSEPWASVDFNCNGEIDSQLYTLDVDGDSLLETVWNDTNDWEMLYFYFADTNPDKPTPAYGAAAAEISMPPF